MNYNFITKLTMVNRDVLSKYISEGDTVVDCTMGNGVDTLMLLQLVGSKGKVYGFDIQEFACDQTKLRIQKEISDTRNVFLINDSHERIKEYIKEPIQAAVFNLGYLPKGNKNITTKAESTIRALMNCMDLLTINGIIAILIYPGHVEGNKEKQVVLDFVRNLDPIKYHTLYLDMINQKNKPPSLLYITKKK